MRVSKSGGVAYHSRLYVLLGGFFWVLPCPLSGLVRSALGAIKIPQVVERLRYAGQIGLRVFLCQLTANLQRLPQFLPGLVGPVLVAINTSQVGERFFRNNGDRRRAGDE